MTRLRLVTDIQVECGAWKRKWRRLEADIGELLEAARPHIELPAKPRSAELSIVLADDQRLKALNYQFRGKNKPTNVLSFPDEDAPIGGIAVAFETIDRESTAQKKSFVNHSKHMILHGFLHLLGYDHIIPRQARLMERTEIAILSTLGISNPYEFKD